MTDGFDETGLTSFILEASIFLSINRSGTDQYTAGGRGEGMEKGLKASEINIDVKAATNHANLTLTESHIYIY